MRGRRGRWVEGSVKGGMKKPKGPILRQSIRKQILLCILSKPDRLVFFHPFSSGSTSKAKDFSHKGTLDAFPVKRKQASSRFCSIPIQPRRKRSHKG